MRYRRPLYLMIKPHPERVTALIALCLELGIELTYSPDRWHCTLLLLGEATPVAIRTILDVIARFDAEPFPVAFDWVKDTTLQPANGLRGASMTQRLLRRHILSAGFGLPDYRFGLHLNLEYNKVSPRRIAIDPIGWLADEILLIESVNGEGRHIQHGSRKLHRRQYLLPFAA